MDRFDARENPAGSKPVSMKPRSASRITGWLMAMVLVPLLPGNGFAHEWVIPPNGQPEQMKSSVKYDPKLSDPFFESEKWTNGDRELENIDGRIVDILQECPSGKEKSQCSKITARCICSLDSEFEHAIHFCEARILDGDRIELLIHDPTLSDVQPYDLYLLIVVEKGVFRSQCWAVYKGARYGDLTWTTKKQELTLDRRVYHKGDTVKGRIVFECAEDVTDPVRGVISTTIIKVNGVFKTVLK